VAGAANSELSTVLYSPAPPAPVLSDPKLLILATSRTFHDPSLDSGSTPAAHEREKIERLDVSFRFVSTI
jgi:hypothetical protein